MGFCQEFIYSFLFSFWLLVKEFLVTMKIYCSEVFQKYKSRNRTFRKCYRDLALTGTVQSLIVSLSPAMMMFTVRGTEAADDGLYECQVSTEKKLSKIVHLHVTGKKTT